MLLKMPRPFQNFTFLSRGLAALSKNFHFAANITTVLKGGISTTSITSICQYPSRKICRDCRHAIQSGFIAIERHESVI